MSPSPNDSPTPLDPASDTPTPARPRISAGERMGRMFSLRRDADLEGALAQVRQDTEFTRAPPGPWCSPSSLPRWA
jgi:hypothetical protein